MIQLSIHKLESLRLVVSVSFNRKSRGPPPATGVCRASRAQAVPPNRGQPPPESAARNRRARPRSERRRGSRRARVEVGGGCRACRGTRKLPRPPPATGPPRREEVAGPSLGQLPWRGSCGVRRPRRACYDLFRRRPVSPPSFIVGV